MDNNNYVKIINSYFEFILFVWIFRPLKSLSCTQFVCLLRIAQSVSNLKKSQNNVIFIYSLYGIASMLGVQVLLGLNVDVIVLTQEFCGLYKNFEQVIQLQYYRYMK